MFNFHVDLFEIYSSLSMIHWKKIFIDNHCETIKKLLSKYISSQYLAEDSLSDNKIINIRVNIDVIKYNHYIQYFLSNC